MMVKNGVFAGDYAARFEPATFDVCPALYHWGPLLFLRWMAVFETLAVLYLIHADCVFWKCQHPCSRGVCFE